MKILIVEDEVAISELMRISLTRAGYTCATCYDGANAIELIEQNQYDLLLLDIMLPNVNGYDILEYIEANIPVIFITAKSSVQDRVKGLHMGADDYIVKPFAIDELLARVESVLRRYGKKTKLEVLDICIDLSSRTVMKQDELIELTNKEYELLLYLIRNKNIALYRDSMYQTIWKEELEESRTLDLHIQRLRKKLNWHHTIKTIFKIGYMLEVPHESI